MISKPIESITEADLLGLIETGTPESKQIEYKRALPDNTDQGKVKFLRSVTAMTNTQGGDVIYGMEAEDGIPQQLCALVTTSDLVLQRLESLCADGVQPRLTGLVHFRFVSLATGGEVLVVRVAKSWNAPHRVTTGNHSHFYGRNANGTYPLDVGELRQAFTLSQTVTERMRSFRADRLLALGNGDAPVNLYPGARVILHVVPLESITSSFRINLSARDSGSRQALHQIAPPGRGSFSEKFNLDGRLSYTNDSAGLSDAYSLLFQNGAIESVEVWQERDGEKNLHGVGYEESIIGTLSAHFSALRNFGISAPAYVF